MSPIPKKYLHDKLLLLLVSGNVFLGFLCAALVFLRLNIGAGDGYIVEYRSNLGIGAFTVGSIMGVVSFVLFAALIVGTNIALSVRIYAVRRELAVAVLSAGVLLLTMAIIVSNALLAL